MKNYLNRLKLFIKNQQFNPGVMGFFINPFYYVRRDIFLKIKSVANDIKGNILDVGCGSSPYKKLFINVDKYIGIDLEKSGHDHSLEKENKIFYDGVTIPFDDNSFDSVISFEVLEHVFTPDRFIDEISRVLKKGGVLLLTVPFIWDEHEVPYDYGRYTSFGLRSILEKHGFEIIVEKKILTDLSFLFQLFNTYIYKIFIKKLPRVLSLPLIMIISILSNLLGLISKILPKNEDLYYGNLILVRKK